MCGLTGIWEYSGAKIQQETLLRMNNTLIHRGPDDFGIYTEPGIGLGHRRLSIIDLSGGKQPLCNEDGAIWVVFNGEIYNFKELGSVLKSKGHIFKTHSDTEVIVHAYEEWGESCIERLHGMFAIALWDSRQKKMVLVRDRLGKKPLYYFENEKRLIFGSEIKAILEYPGISRSVNLQALSDYLSLGYVPSPKTMFTGIFKVPPGCYMVCQSGFITVKKYWDVDFHDDSGQSFKQATQRTRELLFEAVNCRLISEVPLGAFLSGGVDSGSVVAAMSHFMDAPVNTSSIGFSEDSYNEVQFAKDVADRYQSDHHQYIVKPDAVEIIKKLSWFYDEPFGDSSAIPTFYVSNLARQNVTVALSGDGGDENFAGYRRYYFDQRENWVRRFLPRIFREKVIGTMANMYPKADYLPRVFRGKSFLTNISKSPIEGYFRSLSIFSEEDKQDLFNQEIKGALGGYQSLSVFEGHYDAAQSRDLLSKIQYVDFKTYLPDDILVKVDRASMANSLEVRCPLLDHRLIEFVATLPSNFKLRGIEGKVILKQAVRDLLPESIIKRKKMGFGLPVAEWLRDGIQEFSKNIIFESSSHGLFEMPFINRIWDEHQRGIRNRSGELWQLLMFNLWYKRFIEKLDV